MAPIILFELPTRRAGSGDGPLFSPNTWITRMTLLQSGLPFRTVELDLQTLRSAPYFTQRFGERPLVPMIEIPKQIGEEKDGLTQGAVTGGCDWVRQRGSPQGELVAESMNIAAVLASRFPSIPSPYLPSVPSPIDPAHPSLPLARSFATLFKAGLGNSDSRWAHHFELAAEAVALSFPEGPERDYYMGDIKNGPGGWQWIVSLDKERLLGSTRRSLTPVEALLSSGQDGSPAPLFLSSPSAPGLADFVLFGRYAMSAAIDADLCSAIWSADDGAARQRLKIGERRWDGDVLLPLTHAWTERMLDLYDGHARRELQRKG